jgi:hypothetical protein
MPPRPLASPAAAPLVRRASAFAVISCGWAGALNVLPQIYLLHRDTDHKSAVLALILSIGTCAAMAGVALARRQLARGASLSVRGVVAAALGCLAPFVLVIVGVEPLAVYVAAYVAFRFASNWAWNRLDNALLDATDARGATVHATATTGFSLLGYVAGPAVFVLLEGRAWLAAALVVIAGAWAAVAVSDVARAELPPVPSRRTGAAGRIGGAGSWREGGAPSFVAYTLAMATGIAGFFAQLIFLLRDYVAIAEPKRTGGLLMALMGATAVATILASSRARRAAPTSASFAWPPLLPVIGIAIVAARPGLAGLAAASVIAGVGTVRYFLATRLRASSWEGGPGRAAVLSFYNNAPNIAALLAYALSFVLACTIGEAAPLFYPALLATLAIVFASAAIVAYASPFAADRARVDVARAAALSTHEPAPGADPAAHGGSSR